MKRSEPLRADPAKTRAWHQRGRVKAVLRAATAGGDFRDDAGNLIPASYDATFEQLALGAREIALFPGLKRQRRKRRAVIPKGVRAEAIGRSEGLCVMCVYKLVTAGKRPGSAKRAVQVHHVLPRAKWPEFETVTDNLIGCCPGCHDEHERAHRRFPRMVIPECAERLADAHGLSWYLERTYPA